MAMYTGYRRSGCRAVPAASASRPTARRRHRGGVAANTPPRAAITAAVSAFRRTAATWATSWHLARQQLPAPSQAMLEQVEVTVAKQPLLRLQAVRSSDTVFPFLYELSWRPRQSFSPARLRHHGPGPAIRLLPGAGCALGEPDLDLAGAARAAVDPRHAPWESEACPGLQRPRAVPFPTLRVPPAGGPDQRRGVLHRQVHRADHLAARVRRCRTGDPVLLLQPRRAGSSAARS
jgi:hypothetical protein